MNYPETLQNLISCFKKMPGVGEKSAERMAMTIIKSDHSFIDLFSNTLTDCKTKIRKCSKCNNLTDSDLCVICTNKNRNNRIICVVEDVKNLMLIERLGIFKGTYYVLENLVSPFDGVELIKSNIEKLINLIEIEKIEEVIFALKLTIEGETTSLYISKLLENKNVKISKIAQGIPHGADIDYIDAITLEKALEDRKEV